ncbi:MAG: hypothetical protein NVSMB6_12440 [Burkholderiaceae bacterium]
MLVLAVTATILSIRHLWGWSVARLTRLGKSDAGGGDVLPMPGTRVLLAHTVAGIRGAVTLAAAISLPLQIGQGVPFPARDEMILIAGGVILLTMVIATVFLPILLRGLPTDDDKAIEQERADASVKASHAAISAIARESSLEQAVASSDHDVVQLVKDQYQQRIDAENTPHSGNMDTGLDHQTTRQARLIGLRAERDELHHLHASGEINDETLRELIKPLDLAEESLR